MIPAWLNSSFIPTSMLFDICCDKDHIGPCLMRIRPIRDHLAADIRRQSIILQSEARMSANHLAKAEENLQGAFARREGNS